VHLRSGSLSGPADDAGLPPALRLTVADLEEGGPALLRFERPVDPSIREAAGQRGVRLGAYVGDDAFIATLPPGGFEVVRGWPDLAWAAPYHPGLRIGPAVASITADDTRTRIPVTLHLFSHADANAIATRLTSLGLEVSGVARGRSGTTRRAERPGRIVARIDPEDLVRLRAEIAHWPETLWIDRRPVYRLLNDASAWVMQSGLDGNQATPIYDHGILGAGQVIGVLDTGLDADMCFFRDSLGLPPTHEGLAGIGAPDLSRRKVAIVNFLWSQDDPQNVGDWDDQDHGTHVAGSAAGDDLATPGERDAGDGMAPAAKLVIQDGGYGTDDCADLPAIGCPAADLYPFFEQAYLQGAQIHSNSWGDRENFTPFNIYSDGSEAADAFMWDHPGFLLVFAAGNNGPGPATVASPATAKNVVAVGATSHGAGAGSLASFSSQGPTADGRIKPDVTAPGSSVVSANSDGNVTTNNCGTKSSSGTSMACPTMAGIAALAREYYARGFYPGGSPKVIDTFAPSAALLKATLIVAATPMEAVSPPPPSDPQGWGRTLLDDALYFPGDPTRLWLNDVAERFASPADPADSFVLDVLDSGAPLRAALVWTDYPSTPAAATNLVNDLDLEVESPSGTLYRGNVFAGGVSQPGGSPDVLNNVEVVRIESPEAGSWTVRVSPSAIPQPSQGYAIVVTGRLPVAGVALERTALTTDDSVGGNADGVLDPGEWVDLPLTLFNSGDTPATNVTARVESLTPGVEVVVDSSVLPDIPTGQSASTTPRHLQIRLAAGFPCSDPVTLRLTYSADGFVTSEDVAFDSGREVSLASDDFEGTTTWQHVAAESTASTGNWIVGNPVGTGFQPEDDATPAPGSLCLYTAANPGAGVGTDDVDGGVVVARSGAYDLSGHPEARLRVARWFGNRDLGVDAGDFYRLEIRESVVSADELLEELGSSESAATWTRVTFRVADFVTPGPGVELKISAADGVAVGNIIEAAIDEIEFFEPICEIHDPAPNPVDSLMVDHDGTDVILRWSRPSLDPEHGETERYLVYRSATAAGGYTLLADLVDASTDPSYPDEGAAGGVETYFYQVISANPAGDSEPLP